MMEEKVEYEYKVMTKEKQVTCAELQVESMTRFDFVTMAEVMAITKKMELKQDQQQTGKRLDQDSLKNQNNWKQLILYRLICSDKKCTSTNDINSVFTVTYIFAEMFLVQLYFSHQEIFEQ